MKNSMISMIFILCFMSFSIAQAQNYDQHKDRIAKKEKEIVEKKKEIEDAQKAIEKTESDIKEKIKKDKEEARENPKAHGTNTELEKLRADLESKRAALEERKKELEALEEDLKKRQADLEKRLDKKVKGALKARPLPVDSAGLEKYKREMEGWKNDFWGKEEGEEVKKRIRKLIDEKLKAFKSEPSGFMPSGSSFFSLGSNGFEPDPMIEKASFFTRIYLGAQANLTFQILDMPGQKDFEWLEHTFYSNPELVNQGTEEEYFLGSLTEEPGFSNIEQKVSRGVGLEGIFMKTQAWGISIAASQNVVYQRATFPVMVIAAETGTTRQLEGIWDRQAHLRKVTLGIRYQLADSRMAPLGGVGANYAVLSLGAPSLKVGTVKAKVDEKQLVSGLGAYLHAGFKYDLTNFLQITALAEIQYLGPPRGFSYGLAAGCAWGF